MILSIFSLYSYNVKNSILVGIYIPHCSQKATGSDITSIFFNQNSSMLRGIRGMAMFVWLLAFSYVSLFSQASVVMPDAVMIIRS